MARETALVIAETLAEAAEARLTAPAAGVDWFELRIDALGAVARTPEVVARLVAVAARPVIATCRPTSERGGGPDSDSERESLLRAALAGGARLVDLEWNWLRRDPSLVERFPVDRTLLSHHCWESTPPDLEGLFDALLRFPAAAWKLVSHADTFPDALRLVALAQEATRRRLRVSVFGLGPIGRVTRLLGPLAGSWLTYLAPDDGPALAGDPLTRREAVDVYGIGQVPDGVKLLGVVGDPVRRSLSPELHNAVIRRLGERFLYLPFASPDVRPVLDLLRRGDIRGLSVTIPHKESVVALLDRVEADAERVGAVNTIVRQGGELVGWNTDLLAARQILAELPGDPDAPAAVLGAGGAARAVVAALRERGRRVLVVNRNEARGRRLAERLGAEFAGTVPPALDGRGARLLVNATPLGSQGETIPGLPVLGPEWSVLDLAYRRGPTPLEIEAKRSGAAVVGGLEFLVRQAAAQFVHWTGRQVPLELYRQAARAAVDAAPAAAEG